MPEARVTTTPYGGYCACGRWILVMTTHATRPMTCPCTRRWRWVSEAVAEMIPYEIRPALCLDLDGTVRDSRSGAKFGPTDLEDVKLLPGVEETLAQARADGFYIVGISNQGVVGYGTRNEVQVEQIAAATRAAFKVDPFDDLVMAYALPTDLGGKVPPHNVFSLLRKPGYGMLVMAEERARRRGVLIDWPTSLMVGDRPEDESCARAAGVPFRWAWDFFGWEAPALGAELARAVTAGIAAVELGSVVAYETAKKVLLAWCEDPDHRVSGARLDLALDQFRERISAVVVPGSPLIHIAGSYADGEIRDEGGTPLREVADFVGVRARGRLVEVTYAVTLRSSTAAIAQEVVLERALKRGGAGEVAIHRALVEA